MPKQNLSIISNWTIRPNKIIYRRACPGGIFMSGRTVISCFSDRL